MGICYYVHYVICKRARQGAEARGQQHNRRGPRLHRRMGRRRGGGDQGPPAINGLLPSARMILTLRTRPHSIFHPVGRTTAQAPEKVSLKSRAASCPPLPRALSARCHCRRSVNWSARGGCAMVRPSAGTNPAAALACVSGAGPAEGLGAQQSVPCSQGRVGPAAACYRWPPPPLAARAPPPPPADRLLCRCWPSPCWACA